VPSDPWIQPSRQTAPDHRTCGRCDTTYRRPHLGVGWVATVRRTRPGSARHAAARPPWPPASRCRRCSPIGTAPPGRSGSGGEICAPGPRRGVRLGAHRRGGRSRGRVAAAPPSTTRCRSCLVATATVLELPPMASSQTAMSCLCIGYHASGRSGASVGRPLRAWRGVQSDACYAPPKAGAASCGQRLPVPWGAAPRRHPPAASGQTVAPAARRRGFAWAVPRLTRRRRGAPGSKLTQTMSLSPAPPEWGEVLERDVLDDAERVRADHVPARVVREPPPALRSPVPVGADLAVGKTGLSGRTCSRARRATALAPPLAALHRKLESRLGAVYGGVDYFLRPPRLLSRSTTGAAWAALFGALLEETTSDRVARGPSRAMNSVRVARDEAGARRRPQWAPIPSR
jgi:hypothetical protein